MNTDNRNPLENTLKEMTDPVKGRQWICTYREGKLKASNPLIDFSRELLIDVYHWTHTEKTMLIVL